MCVLSFFLFAITRLLNHFDIEVIILTNSINMHTAENSPIRLLSLWGGPPPSKAIVRRKKEAMLSNAKRIKSVVKRQEFLIESPAFPFNH